MRKILWIYVVVGVTSLVCSCGAKDLKENGQVINVKIVDYLPPGKSMSQANYRCEFVYNGEVKNLISQSSIRHNKSLYVGEYFPAMYSPKTDAIRILMLPEDFSEFNIPYPDSLLSRVIQ